MTYKDNINLWNVSAANAHKTRNVIEYIKNLGLPETKPIGIVNKFNKIKKEALNNITPDAMLERIGYKYHGVDGIYAECEEDRL